MKTMLTCLMAFALAATTTHAQLTLTAADVAFIGLNLSNVQDTLPDASIVAGPAGQDRTWDFSSLHSHEIYSFETLEADETPYHDEFPPANFAAIENGTYGYFEKDSDGLRFLGFYGDYEFEPGLSIELGIHSDPAQSILRFPTIFNDGFSETYQRIIAVSGEDAGDQIDSIRIVSTVQRSVSYDAYGTLTTPAGTFQVLRVKETETSVDTIHYLFEGNWLSLPGEEPITDVAFNFWTKHDGIGFPVASIQADEFGNTVSASWFKDFVSPTKEATTKIKLEVFPNPTVQWLNVELPENFSGQLEVYDAGSRMVASQQAQNHLERIDVTVLHPGSYVVIAKDDKNRMAGYKKFEIAR